MIGFPKSFKSALRAFLRFVSLSPRLVPKPKYTVLELETASKINEVAPWQDPVSIGKFQEATGIANENDPDYGQWTEETAKIHFEIMMELKK